MKNKNIFKLIKCILALAFLIGGVGIAVYPFPNRNLTMTINTDAKTITIPVTRDEIIQGNNFQIEMNGYNELKIYDIKLYSHTILLAKINFNEIPNYIESICQGEQFWEAQNIIVSGKGSITLNMNAAFNDLLTHYSDSFLQERLLILEFYTVIIAGLWIICKMVQEKNENSNHGPIYEANRFLNDIVKYSYYMIYSAQTDLRAEVANSYLNRLWWLLEPFFNMLVYVIVFGKVMGNSIENYATYVFSALLLWNYFSKTVNYSVKLVRTNKEIVTKVYIPKFVLLLSNMFLNLFKLLFSLIVLVAMMLLFRVHIGLNLLWVIPAYIVTTLLAFGVGMIFLHYGVFIDDLSYAVIILLNMLMFLSGVFYEVLTTLPEPLNIIMMYCNPVAMLIDTMRNALLYNTASNLLSLGMWFLISLILSYVGIHIVYKNENGYVKVV